MEYDFRSRFQLGLRAIGPDVSLPEAVRLVRVLRSDPSSETAAALEGWTHSMSREALMIADLFDLSQATGGVKKVKPHPARPWKNVDERRHGSPRPMREVAEILNRYGHALPV